MRVGTDTDEPVTIDAPGTLVEQDDPGGVAGMRCRTWRLENAREAGDTITVTFPPSTHRAAAVTIIDVSTIPQPDVAGSACMPTPVAADPAAWWGISASRSGDNGPVTSGGAA